MTDILFERKVKITITDLNINQSLDILSEDNRIILNGHKSIDSLPNLALIDVYNPDETFVNFSSREDLRVDILTKYGDDEYSILFTGDLKRSYFPNNNVDNILRLDIGDAEKSITESFISKSYTKGIRKKTIVKDCLDIMGIDILTNTLSRITGSYNGGFVCFNKCIDILDIVINSLGLEYSIQNNQIIITKPNEINTVDFKEVNYDLGLLDKPVPLQDGGYLIKNQLDNQFSCHGTILLNIEDINEFYQVRYINFNGDSDFNLWESNIVCQ